jgi:hypothetical protein
VVAYQRQALDVKYFTRLTPSAIPRGEPSEGHSTDAAASFDGSQLEPHRSGNMLMSTPLRRMALRLLAYLDAAYSVAPPVPKSFPHDSANWFFDYNRRWRIIDGRWWRIHGAARQRTPDQRSTDEATGNASRYLTVLRPCIGNARNEEVT